MFKKMFANCLLVSDFEKSLDFYQNKMWLELNYREGNFANFKVENIELAIMDKNNTKELGVEKYINKGGAMFLCFQTENVEKTYQELNSRGVEFITKPIVTSWGQNVAYFTDPDLNIWEVSKV